MSDFFQIHTEDAMFHNKVCNLEKSCCYDMLPFLLPKLQQYFSYRIGEAIFCIVIISTAVYASISLTTSSLQAVLHRSIILRRDVRISEQVLAVLSFTIMAFIIVTQCLLLFYRSCLFGRIFWLLVTHDLHRMNTGNLYGV